MALLRALLVAFGSGAPALAAAQDAPAPGAERSWSGNLQAYLHLQENDDFLTPILGIDRGALHLEGRFQHENRRTGSFWAGWTLEAGNTLHLEATTTTCARPSRS